MTDRTILESHGRLTTGNAPLHVRRKHLSNQLRDTEHMLKTTLANWPAEFALPADHNLFELLEVMIVVADQLETPDGQLETSSRTETTGTPKSTV